MLGVANAIYIIVEQHSIYKLSMLLKLLQQLIYAGYHYNADTQMYFDDKTGGYYSGADSKWYLFDDNTQQLKEWQQ